jgi:hypothetical protein
MPFNILCGYSCLSRDYRGSNRDSSSPAGKRTDLLGLRIGFGLGVGVGVGAGVGVGVGVSISASLDEP